MIRSESDDNINIDMVAFDGANSMVVLFNNYTSTKNMTVKGLGDRAQVPDDRDGKHGRQGQQPKLSVVQQRFAASKSVVLIVTNAGRGEGRPLSSKGYRW